MFSKKKLYNDLIMVGHIYIYIYYSLYHANIAYASPQDIFCCSDTVVSLTLRWAWRDGATPGTTTLAAQDVTPFKVNEHFYRLSLRRACASAQLEKGPCFYFRLTDIFEYQACF